MTPRVLLLLLAAPVLTAACGASSTPTREQQRAARTSAIQACRAVDARVVSPRARVLSLGPGGGSVTLDAAPSVDGGDPLDADGGATDGGSDDPGLPSPDGGAAIDAGVPGDDGGSDAGGPICTCAIDVDVDAAPPGEIIGAALVAMSPHDIAALPVCPEAGAPQTQDEICVSTTELHGVPWSPSGTESGTVPALVTLADSPRTELALYGVDVALELQFDGGTAPPPDPSSCAMQTVQRFLCRANAALPLPGLDRERAGARGEPVIIPPPTTADIASIASMQAYIDANIGDAQRPYLVPDQVTVGPSPDGTVTIARMSRGNALLTLVAALQSAVRAYAEAVQPGSEFASAQARRDDLYRAEAALGGVLTGGAGDARANVTSAVRVGLGACSQPTLPDSGFYAGFLAWSTYVTATRAGASLTLATMSPGIGPNGAAIPGSTGGLPFATKVPFSAAYGLDPATNYKCLWSQAIPTVNSSTNAGGDVQDPTQCSQCFE